MLLHSFVTCHNCNTLCPIQVHRNIP